MESNEETGEAPGLQHEPSTLSFAKVSGDPRDKLRAASKEQQASTQASDRTVQAATASDVDVDNALSESAECSATRFLISPPPLESSNDDLDNTHVHSNQLSEVLETSVPIEPCELLIPDGTHITENTERVDVSEKIRKPSQLTDDAANEVGNNLHELEPQSFPHEATSEERREVHCLDTRSPIPTIDSCDIASESLGDVAPTDCTSNSAVNSESQATLVPKSDSDASFRRQATDSFRSPDLDQITKADAMTSLPSSRAMGPGFHSRPKGDNSANALSLDPLSTVSRFPEDASPTTAINQEDNYSSATHSGPGCSPPKAAGSDIESEQMFSTFKDVVSSSHNNVSKSLIPREKVEFPGPKTPMRDQTAPVVVELVHDSLTQSSTPTQVISTFAQESSTPRTGDTACTKDEIDMQEPTAGAPQDATQNPEIFSARSNVAHPDLQPQVYASPAATNSLPVRKTPPQQATLNQLRAERGTLLASLASLPAIRVLIEERAAEETENVDDDDAPSESDVMLAANELVKKHIKLLHQYNELKDVGQGLMGLIADQRGLRIVEVQETFGIESQD